jgi:hypothetical protein
MRQRIIGLAAAVVAGLGGVAVTASAAHAVPSGCGAPNYTANWVGVTCTGGTGQFRLGVSCLILGSGGQTRWTYGPWKNTPTTNYANCAAGSGPLQGSVILYKR